MVHGIDAKGNFSSKGTTPVAQYPKGASVYGAMDPIGNVWEWCLTKLHTGEQTMERADIRAVRGGSWSEVDSNLLRMSYRNGGTPDDQLAIIRFQCVRLR